MRTGLTKVGLPGAPEGMQVEDPTMAVLLKEHGYMTGQFGKNHLGDRDEMLPTNHGFDEFFGNLYHLNAEQEPEHPDYPGDFEFPDGETLREKFGPRGVIHSYADGRIEDTGPLTIKRMETVDEEVTTAALGFMENAPTPMRSRSSSGGTPRACTSGRTSRKNRRARPASASTPTGWSNTTVWSASSSTSSTSWASRTTPSSCTRPTTARKFFSWPDGGTTVFRNEKATQWEGGFRVPTAIRWPGVIEPGTVINDIGAHEDMLPTLLAAAGDPNVKEDLLQGKTVGDRTYKVHLDAYNLLPALKGEAEWPRSEFLYWTDDGNVAALRYNNWKITFLRQEHEGIDVWTEPFNSLRAPMLANLRMDPFERAFDESIGYPRWWVDHMFVFGPASAYIGQWLQSFRDFPPRQEPGSFNLDKVMDAITKAAGDK